MALAPTTPPGGFMTKAQFLTTKAAKKGGTYQGYKDYVTNKRSQKRAAEAEKRANEVVGFASNAPGVIPLTSAVTQANNWYPNDPTLAALTQQQVQSQASGMVTPVFQKQIDLITNSFKQRGQAGANAITGYMGNYLKSLPAIQANIAGIYDQAKNEQSNVTASLANFIRDQGSSLQSQLQAQEGAAGQTSAGSDVLGAVGQGAAGAGAAYGQSTLGRLIGEGAATNAYAAQLPVYGRALGAQTLGNFQGQLTNELSNQVTDINSQLPAALQNAYQSLLDRELTKASGRQTIQGNRADYVNTVMDRNAALEAARASIYQNAQQGSDSYYDASAGAAADLAKDTPSLQDKMSGSLPDFVKYAKQERWTRNPKTGDFPTWGDVRRQLVANIKGTMPEMTNAQRIAYVDTILRGAGWVPPGKKKPGAAAAAPGVDVGAGLTGPTGVSPTTGNWYGGDLQSAINWLMPSFGFGLPDISLPWGR